MIVDKCKYMWSMNKFFWKESHTFVQPWTWQDVKYAPTAWYIFMRLSNQDYNDNIKK